MWTQVRKHNLTVAAPQSSAVTRPLQKAQGAGHPAMQNPKPKDGATKRPWRSFRPSITSVMVSATQNSKSVDGGLTMPRTISRRMSLSLYVALSWRISTESNPPPGPLKG